MGALAGVLAKGAKDVRKGSTEWLEAKISVIGSCHWFHRVASIIMPLTLIYRVLEFLEILCSAKWVIISAKAKL